MKRATPKHVLRMVSNVPPLFDMRCDGVPVDFDCEVNPLPRPGKLDLAFVCKRCGFMIGRTFNLKWGNISDPPDR